MNLQKILSIEVYHVMSYHQQHYNNSNKMKEEFDKRLSPFYFKTGLINMKICTCDFLILFTISHIFLLKKLDFKTVKKTGFVWGYQQWLKQLPDYPCPCSVNKSDTCRFSFYQCNTIFPFMRQFKIENLSIESGEIFRNPHVAEGECTCIRLCNLFL